MVYFETLSNGIRVAAEQMPSFRSVSLAVWVGAGSIYENDSERGASHFIEHMIFKGTDSRTAAEIACVMDGIGGNINAFTAKECTCFYAKVLDEHLEKAVDILSDIVISPRLAAEDIEREKGVVIEEILMMEDSPEDLVHETLCGLVYAGCPLALPILGTRDSVGAFSRDTLIEYMGKHYNASNIVISCAGNFDRDKLREMLERYFSKLPGGGVSMAKSSVVRTDRAYLGLDKDIEQAHVALGFPGYRTDCPEQYALFVLNNALGGSMSSRLFQRIREDMGLAYSVYSYPSSYADTGYFTLYAGTGEKQAKKVTELMLEEIEKLKASGITKDEFDRAKEQLKGNYMLGQESTSARSNAIGKSYLAHGKVYTEDEILKRIEAVSMEDVARAAGDVFDLSRASAAVVSRGTKKAGIEKLISEG